MSVRKYSFFVIVIFVALFFARPALAASVIVSAPSTVVGSGSEVPVRVELSAPLEKVNAFSGELNFSAALLEPVTFETGNSIVNFWVENPSVTAPGRIRFAGITPGGFTGERGTLFTVIFKTQSSGNARVTLRESQFLLNDGNGTAAPITSSPLSFTISTTVPASTLPATVDKDKPESFVPTVGKDPALFDGKWFVAFATQDKGVGVAYYEMQESKSAVANESAWQRAESPAVLGDQSRKSTVFIRAIDKQGNSIVASVAPYAPARSWKTYVIYGTILVLAILVLFTLWRRKKQN